MSEPAAILATFTDFDLVQTRKVAKLVFEVPIEEFKAALDKLGMPEPAGGTWCGIARVTKPAGGAAIHPNSGDGHIPGSRLEAPPAKPFGDAPTREDGDEARSATHAPSAGATSPKPNSTRAVMMAKDPELWAYLTESEGYPVDCESKADVAIKNFCDVRSKSDLNSGIGASNFQVFRESFHAWRQARGHARAA